VLARALRHPSSNTRCGYLILPLSVDMPSLLNQGKHYPWPRPPRCPRCGGLRLWGHGYVPRYFDNLVEPVWVKRWRCPECCAVHTLRPDTHWRRFWAPLVLIVVSLRGKLEGQHWGHDFPRQRQQYWWQGFLRQSRLEGKPHELDALLPEGIIVATHSLSHRAIIPWPRPAYPRLAVTGPPCPP
jgi:hypothetical protein